MNNDPGARDEFSRRIACVRRILAALNGQRGRPLDDNELGEVEGAVYLAIWQRLGSYEAIAPLESWFYRICEFQLKEAIRRKSRRRSRSEPLDETQLQANGAGPDASVLDGAEVEHMLQLLGGMEAKVLGLKHLEGLTFQEIADRLGLSPNTAKTLHYRGLRRLRQLLDEERGGADGGRASRAEEPGDEDGADDDADDDEPDREGRGGGT